MYTSLLHVVLFASLAVIVYLFARAVPRVEDAPVPARSRGRFDALLKTLPLDKLDEYLRRSFEKLLRRMKVVLMKSNNFVDDRLGLLKKTARKKREEDEKPDLFNGLNGGTKE